MMIFSEDIDIMRSILARFSSYLVSLLDTGKYSRMACSIFSPVGALSCNPAPVYREVSSTLRIH